MCRQGYLENCEKKRVSASFFWMKAMVGAARKVKMKVVGSKERRLAKTAPTRLKPMTA